MSSIKYILSKLKELVKQIHEIQILYKYHAFGKEHLIKVLPLNEFKNNKEFNDLQSKIIFDFISKYPYECLVFFSENDCIDINEEPDKIIIGKRYNV